MESKKSQNSTLAISHADSKDLERFCQKIGITKKEYIRLSLNYFRRYGIDPMINENPHSEVTKILKRVEDLFAFGKAQETKILLPFLKRIEELFQTIKGENEQEQINLKIILYILCIKDSEKSNISKVAELFKSRYEFIENFVNEKIPNAH